jgi:hypothetical protein
MPMSGRPAARRERLASKWRRPISGEDCADGQP